MADSSNQNAATRIAAMQQQLDQLHTNLTRERRRVNVATLITAVIGAVALLALSVYFYIGYREINSVAEPEKLVDFAETMINDTLPEARAALEQQIKEQAPVMAESLSKQLQESMPSLRKELTDRFIDEADRMTQEALVLSEDKYRAYLKENKTLLKTKFEELSTSPTLAEKSLKEIEIELDKQLSEDMKVDAKALSKDIAGITENLKFLAEGKNLKSEQQVERRVWMLARRLQLDAQIPTPEVGGLTDPQKYSEAELKKPIKKSELTPKTEAKAPADKPKETKPNK